MIELRSDFTLQGRIRIDTFDGDLPEMSSTELEDFLDRRWPRLWTDRHVTGVAFPNLVVNNGRTRMTQLIVGETTLMVGYVALSTSVIVPALADVALPTELIRKVVSIRQSVSSTYQRYVGSFTTADFNSTGILAGGLFDTASTGGQMFADASIALSKSGTQAATVDWRVNATT